MAVAETIAENTEEAPAAVTEEAAAAPASGEQPATEKVAEEAPVEAEKAVEKTDEEKAADAKKEAEKPAGWKAVEAAKREQLKLAKVRTELQGREATLAQREQHFTQQVERFNAWSHQLQERAQRIENFDRAVETGDLETLQKDFKLDYAKLTQRAIEAQDPSGRVARMERELAEQREREKASQVSQAQVEQTRHDARTLVAIVDEFGDKDYPDLIRWKPERIALEGLNERDAMLRRREQPTYDKVLRKLQERAKDEQDYAQKRNGSSQRSGTDSSAAGGAGNADKKGTSGSPNETPALSGKTSVIRATPAREKTDDEIDEECRSMIRTGIVRK